METFTELTQEYLRVHPDVKSCLKKGLINYSALTRQIICELSLNHSSADAILVACRRFKEKLSRDMKNERKIKEILDKSAFEIKTRCKSVVIKKTDWSAVDGLRSAAQKSGTWYCIDNTDSYVAIVPESVPVKNSAFVTENLSLIVIKSSPDIEKVSGVIGYLTSLFAENGVNIVEFFSCWTETILAVHSKDLSRVLEFLKL